MAYKVMIANPDLWPQQHKAGLSKEDAREEAREWNRERGFPLHVEPKDAVSRQAYVEKE